MASKQRPIRSVVESITDKIPDGPLGVSGGGDLIGLAGFAGVTAVNKITPLPVGYTVQSSSVSGSGKSEIHTYEIWSTSKDVARFVALKQSAGPNINLVTHRPEVIDVELVNENPAHSLWRIEVEVERPNTSEGQTSRVTQI